MKILLPLLILPSLSLSQPAQVPLAQSFQDATQSLSSQTPTRTGPLAWAMKNILRFNDTQIENVYTADKRPESEFVEVLDDDNWEEVLLGEGSRGKVWVIDVYGTKQKSMEIYSENHLALAENNSSLAGGDLSDIYRFATVDYINVNVITTIWMLMKPPWLVLSHLPEDAPSPASLQDVEFRFYGIGTVIPDEMGEFLATEAWRKHPVWKGTYWSPDGPGGQYLPTIGQFFAKLNGYTSKIPSWFFLVGSGFLANMTIGLFHKKEEAKTLPDGTKVIDGKKVKNGRWVLESEEEKREKEEEEMKVKSWGSKKDRKKEDKWLSGEKGTTKKRK